MIFLCLLANAINYIDRATLAVAAPSVREELGIDAATMGVLLSGFFWTYALTQMPFGWFADKVGARISLLIAVVWWSIFTALTAAARNVAAFLGCRLLLGIGEAGAYPSCAKVTAASAKRAGARQRSLRPRITHRIRALNSPRFLVDQFARMERVILRDRRSRVHLGDILDLALP